MKELYKNSLLLIHSLTQLCGICYKYYEVPTDDAGNEIIEIIDKCEKKFLKVKEEVVKMVRNVEIQSKEHKEISTTQTESGFLINKE